jgi:hypothetical protein
MSDKDYDRKEVLLKAAHDLLKKCHESPFTASAITTTVFYDEAKCDGTCLMHDIAIELGIFKMTGEKIILDTDSKPARHKHADLIHAWADGAEIQVFERGEWKPVVGNSPYWLVDSQYRIKPKTILINGFEVPEPVRKALHGQILWTFGTGSENGFSYPHQNSARDIERLKAGLVHATKEDAELHRKALLSFTRIDNGN